MSYETILFEVREGAGHITLNRPDKYNAFTRQLHQELQDALKAAERDRAVRAVVITGAGKAFCSGQDLGEAAAQQGPLGDAVRRLYNPLVQRLRGMEKPVLAAVNGVAAGAGMSLALACDLRIASERASFTTAFVNIGLVPDTAISFVLPRLVGMAKAMELCLMGDRITAADAERLGLVNRTYPEAEFPAAVEQWAARLARGPRSMGYIKRMLNRSVTTPDLDSQLEHEAWFQELASRTGDAREGITAFLEKRPAQFKGE